MKNGSGNRIGKCLSKYAIFGVMLTVLSCFYFIICYYQMRIGDDTLTIFFMGFRNYLDGTSWEPVEKITTVKQAIEQYVQYYLTFNGRITFLLQGLLFNLWGEKIISICSAAIYVGTILAVSRIGLGSWENVTRVSIILLLCSLYMYQLSPTGTYISMWTFVCQYAVPVLLFLILYLLMQKAYHKEKLSWKQEIFLWLFGFICGLCHECLGLFAILLVSISAFREGLFRKTMPAKRIWLNSGLWLGYILVVLAPGNYKRLFMDHDVARMEMDVLNKIRVSVYEHLISAGVLTRTEIWMVLLFAIAIIGTYVKKRYSILKFLESNIEFLTVVLISIPVWAVFAPPVPQYGLQLWKACVVILLLKAIDVNILTEAFWSFLGIFGLIAFLLLNFSWIFDLVEITVERREQIYEAKMEGEGVVYVKRYPDSTYGYLTMYNYTNQKYAFGSDCDKKYYGIKILVEDEE